MAHLIYDLAKIGLIIFAAAICVSAFIGTAGMNYDPYGDEFYRPEEDGE